MPRRSSPWFLFLFASTVLASLSLFSAAFPFFKDSGELVSSMATAGISHPTGFPLQHALARVFCLLPLGPVPFRLALLSALGGAVTGAAAVVLAGRLSCPGPGLPSRFAALPLAAGGLASLLAATNWFHAVNVEVYLPSLAFSAALLCSAVAVLSQKTKRRILLFALLAGLSTGMHITCFMVAGISGLFVLGACLANANSRKGLLASLPPALALFAAGVLVLAYLPVRSGAGPIRDWGHPAGLAAFLGHITGSSIRSSFTSEMLQFDWAHVRGHLTTYADQMVSQAGLALMLAAAGIAAAVRERSLRPATLLLVAVWLADACFSIFINPMAQKEMQTSSLSLLLAMVFAAAGAVRLLLWLPRLPRLNRRYPEAAIAAVLAVLIVVSPLVSESMGERDSRTTALPYQLGRSAFAATGPDGILVTGEDDLSAMSLYLSEVECRRPDVLPMVKQMACEPSMSDPLLRRFSMHPVFPSLGTLADQACTTNTGDDIPRFWALFAEHCPSGLPVTWELSDGAVDRLWGPRLVPGFPAFSTHCGVAHAPVSPSRASQAQKRYHDVATQALANDADPISRAVLSEWGRLSAAHFMRRGRMSDPAWMVPAMQAIEDAATLTPDNCRVLNNLAVGLGAQGRFSESVAVCDRAVQECPLYLTARINLVRFALFAEQRGRAATALSSLAAKFQPPQYLAALERLAAQLDSLKRFEDAKLVRERTSDQ